MEKKYEEKEIESWENHYLKQIEFILKQDLDKMLEGLKSKDKIKGDWFSVFNSSNKKRQNSDFARGAERIYYWLFNQFGIPNSSPIGSDMFFETYNAFIHIDIKTAKFNNYSDYYGKLPIGANQTSYKYDGYDYTVNLPPIYKYENKLCLTYFINIVYDITYDNIVIKSIIVLCVPNGLLTGIYKNDIINAGKSGNSGNGFRYKFSNRNKFELLDEKPSRIIIIYLSEDLIDKKDTFCGIES